MTTPAEAIARIRDASYRYADLIALSDAYAAQARELAEARTRLAAFTVNLTTGERE